MQDSADSDLRQNIKTILGISVQGGADLMCSYQMMAILQTPQTPFPLVSTPKRHRYL
jgi:hypothetical protein